jgi:hypothetical protein
MAQKRKTKSKKSSVQVHDLKPTKDAKGGVRKAGEKPLEFMAFKIGQK